MPSHQPPRSAHFHRPLLAAVLAAAAVLVTAPAADAFGAVPPDTAAAATQDQAVSRLVGPQFTSAVTGPLYERAGRATR
ncbi:hypothetical protein ABZ461_35190 [Actinacidiphila glaucinigra]|uniref:hypothetical protein n=1 Tax=Actinacidiphila glaucinigra TaxID=235986 RepID=UPI0033F21E29